MAAAPTVQSLNDIIGQVTAAQAPQQSQIDQEIAANDASGTAQKSGLDAAQNNAFGKINQEAENKGMYFSGFTPATEATYTGSTYLPALAKLQTTIANTRQSLLGQKAGLTAQANKDAMTIQGQQQSQLDAYNRELQSEEAARQMEAQREAAAAAQTRLAASLRPAPAAKAITGYGVVHVANNGGLQFHGPNGQPISAGAYLDAISGGQAGTQDLANILAGSNSANDQKIAKVISGMTTAQAQKAYPWLFQ